MDGAVDGAAVGRRALAKAALRLIPFMFLLYIVAFLDRVNVGYAALQMNEDLGFSDAVYGLGAGIFFIGYLLFEVPSNLILERVGARVWIARIMITWGLISSAMFLVQGPVSFYVLRFLLGVAEAGFFPGMILYLTYWFPARERAKMVALFMTAVAVAGVIGGPLSGWLLTFDGVFGLEGWQFLFLAEGIPAILLGFVVLAYLPDGPAQARWLEPEERRWLEETLERENEIKRTHGEHTLRRAMTNGRVWLLSLVYFGIVTSLYGISFWLPTIIEEFSGLEEFLVGLLSAIPYLAAAVGMVVFAWHSDRTGERRWHLAVPAALAALGMALTGPAGGSAVLQMAVLTLAALGIYSCLGTFWTLPAAFLSGTAAAAGIALINSVGNLGGFVGPYVVGYIRDLAGANYGAMLFLAAMVLLSGLLVLLVRHDRSLEEVEEATAAGPAA
ncbi:MFS transporter [Rubrobacter xylanophilus]|uniref:Putative tartrate transporter n=1 Tax=Rubrobacter xylanophilus TaxID=49319 RepID=A0A510HKL4_9ACTN|nr:MFS transporter [Rubrobacter xylanophilus]BBL79845.1 MFS transporter [Rubrobacter xylanophilus]